MLPTRWKSLYETYYTFPLGNDDDLMVNVIREPRVFNTTWELIGYFNSTGEVLFEIKLDQQPPSEPNPWEDGQDQVLFVDRFKTTDRGSGELDSNPEMDYDEIVGNTAIVSFVLKQSQRLSPSIAKYANWRLEACFSDQDMTFSFLCTGHGQKIYPLTV